MIKESALKIFLSNGITLTVKENEKIKFAGDDADYTMFDVYNTLAKAINNKNNVEFMAIIDHEYKEEEETKHQEICHKYFIPFEKITWFMIELFAI